MFKHIYAIKDILCLSLKTGWIIFGWEQESTVFLGEELSSCFGVYYGVGFFPTTASKTNNVKFSQDPCPCLCWRKRGTSPWVDSSPFMTWLWSPVCPLHLCLLPHSAPGKHFFASSQIPLAVKLWLSTCDLFSNEQISHKSFLHSSVSSYFVNNL